jgi:anti-sigma factor (TIGR02949 family)
MARKDRIDCEEAVRRLATYLDRELDDRSSQELETHLEVCRSCYSREAFERRLKDRIREDLGMSDVPPEFQERMRVLIRGLARKA